MGNSLHVATGYCIIFIKQVMWGKKELILGKHCG